MEKYLINRTAGKRRGSDPIIKKKITRIGIRIKWKLYKIPLVVRRIKKNLRRRGRRKETIIKNSFRRRIKIIIRRK